MVSRDGTVSTTPNDSRTRTLFILARVFAVATIADIALLFVTAGRLVQKDEWEEIHGTGAIILHVVSGFLALALIALAAGRRAPGWPAGLAVVLFGYSFLQAYLGKGRTLYLHIPGALLVVSLSVWLVVWVFLRRPDHSDFGRDHKTLA
jgi:hypothetical protein